jgi:hypothetical protein
VCVCVCVCVYVCVCVCVFVCVFVCVCVVYRNVCSHLHACVMLHLIEQLSTYAVSCTRTNVRTHIHPSERPHAHTDCLSVTLSLFLSVSLPPCLVASISHSLLAPQSWPFTLAIYLSNRYASNNLSLHNNNGASRCTGQDAAAAAAAAAATTLQEDVAAPGCISHEEVALKERSCKGGCCLRGQKCGAGRSQALVSALSEIGGSAEEVGWLRGVEEVHVGRDREVGVDECSLCLVAAFVCVDVWMCVDNVHMQIRVYDDSGNACVHVCADLRDTRAHTHSHKPHTRTHTYIHT